MTFTASKGQNTTIKSETWLKVSSKIIPNMSLYKNPKPAWRPFKIPNHLPQKNALCQNVPNVNVLDVVGFFLEV